MLCECKAHSPATRHESNCTFADGIAVGRFQVAAGLGDDDAVRTYDRRILRMARQPKKLGLAAWMGEASISQLAIALIVILGEPLVYQHAHQRSAATLADNV